MTRSRQLELEGEKDGDLYHYPARLVRRARNILESYAAERLWPKNQALNQLILEFERNREELQRLRNEVESLKHK